MESIIKTQIKTIDKDCIKDCKVYGTIGFDRYLIANCDVKIKIYSKEHIVNNNRIKKCYASIILCDNINIVRKDIDDDKILHISNFEISADIYDRNGTYYKTIFHNLSGIEIEDDIWTFEILDYKQVIKLRDEF